MNLKRIHVNRNVIDRNRKRGEHEPPLSVRHYPWGRKTAAAIEYGRTVVIRHQPTGDVVAVFLYRPDDPLECGARLWVETEHDVEVLGPGEGEFEGAARP